MPEPEPVTAVKRGLFVAGLGVFSAAVLAKLGWDWKVATDAARSTPKDPWDESNV